MRTVWFIFFLAVVAVAAGFVLIGPDRMYHLALDGGKAAAPQMFAEDTAPKPEDTLVAPFADVPGGAGQIGSAGTLATDKTPLDQPHRTADEISRWLITAVSSSLSFGPGNLADIQKKISPYFLPEGMTSYQTFLDVSGYRARVVNNGESMHNYVKEQPFLLNSGAVGGAYHWLFEVPVMVSFMPKGQTDVKTANFRNEEILINIDVQRVAEERGDSIRIYNWTARLKPQQ